jgi:aminopeptidase YwaD
MFENSSPTRSLTVAAPYEQCRRRNRDRQGADRRRNLRSFFIAALISIPLLAADINPDQYLAHVRYLASPELKGRATGSPGLEKAAHYIAAQFRSFGLSPTELPFPATLGAHLGNKNHLKFKEPNEPARTLTSGKDFLPLSFSSSGELHSSVVFAGFGITDKKANYDDYDGIDVTGKFVLILRHEPKENPHQEHVSFADKAVNAKMHGARGVILVNDTDHHEGAADDIGKFSESAGPKNAGVLYIHIKYDTAEDWLKQDGHDLHALSKQIDQDGHPHSFAIPNLTVDLSVDVRTETKTVHNVSAYLPGETDEYVIVGAHYDHLGLGGENSLAPSQIGTIHPGADDNASGTAGVIELARWASKQPKQKRGILFLTFAGEELGLLGSEFYVNHPTTPLEKAVAMINMDMIGRIKDGKIYLSGTGTGSTFPQLIADVKPPAPLQIDIAEKAGYGSSDHTSFTTKNVPVLFFFSGLHADYHKPSDTADKINSADAAKLLDYIADLVAHLENDPRPQYIRVAAPSTGPVGSGGGSGYGPNFGSIPDFNEPAKGVRFADVRDGTPAAKAGLKAGDILIEFDGKEIANLYDFTYALRAHKPGDLVPVKVLRGDKTIEAKVLLTERH